MRIIFTTGLRAKVFNRSLTTRTLAKAKDKVYVAMSGGVDSTVSAYLLKEQGYDVEGIYMKNWDSRDDENHPCNLEYEKVQSIANKLNLPLRQFNFIKEYWMQVFELTLEQYRLGLTPNPDLLCNQTIKFGHLIENLKLLPENKSKKVYLATGHYAKLKFDAEHNINRLFTAKDRRKDQTYYLASVPLQNFNNVLFPLSDMEKSQVKALAQEIGLADIAKQKESMGICFVGKVKRFSYFLESYLEPRPGPILLAYRKIEIGQHNGIFEYTLGQRIRLSYKSRKWFVVKKDVENNAIFVADNNDHPMLYRCKIIVEDFNFSYLPPPNELYKDDLMYVKVRSTAPLQKARVVVEVIGERYRVKIDFVEPVRAVTPGQFVVLYSLEEECLGSGCVEK